MMVWGHATGVVATGILLLRVVDPDFKSRGVEDSGIADILNRPIVIALQVLPPLFLSMGGSWPHIVTWTITGATVLLLIVAKALGWWRPDSPVQRYREG
ncbi:MAG: glutamate:Na+ symporter, family [Bacillota bacterium]|jgi:ESS family glutamate:Na+ symporter|nr:glutamate:Na+ symporter, family [Bacillota bacterium]